MLFRSLAPVRLVGFGMGGWFLSTAIGNNLSGIFASHVSGEGGMTVASAQAGYNFGFWALVGAGVLWLKHPALRLWWEQANGHGVVSQEAAPRRLLSLMRRHVRLYRL